MPPESDAPDALQPVEPTGNGRARGLVSSRSSGSRVESNTWKPPPDLQDVVQCFWTGRWDLTPDAPHHTELLSDPCVNLVLEGGDRVDRRVVGVWTKLWRRTLSGRGWVRGVKLWPGATRSFIDVGASTYADAITPWQDLLGDDARTVDLAATLPDDDAAFRALVAWLRERRRPDDTGHVQLAVNLLQRVQRDTEVLRVEQLAKAAGLGLRALQQLFREHVGASPKWVIRRCRLQEVALRLEKGESRSLASLAAELGYTDQAHLTRDFKSAVGKSPRTFATLVHR